MGNWGKEAQTQGEHDVTTEAEIEWFVYKPRKSKDHRPPPESSKGKKDPLLEISEGAQSCQHFDWGLPASRTVQPSVSVAWSHQCVALCYSSPGELEHWGPPKQEAVVWELAHQNPRHNLLLFCTYTFDKMSLKLLFLRFSIHHRKISEITKS